MLAKRGELERTLAVQTLADGFFDEEYATEFKDVIDENWAAADIAVIEPPQRVEPTAESIASGRRAYFQLECIRCHGGDGRGSQATVGVDAWGLPAEIPDLTSGLRRCGPAAADVYRVIAGGVDGTPMPGVSAEAAADPGLLWDLTNFVLDLERRRRVAEPNPLDVWRRSESNAAASKIDAYDRSRRDE